MREFLFLVLLYFMIIIVIVSLLESIIYSLILMIVERIFHIDLNKCSEEVGEWFILHLESFLQFIGML